MTETLLITTAVLTALSMTRTLAVAWTIQPLTPTHVSTSAVTELLIQPVHIQKLVTMEIYNLTMVAVLCVLLKMHSRAPE